MKNSLILEPTKYPRDNPDIVFGKVKPKINKHGFKEYPDDYNPILEYWEQIQKKQVNVSKKIYQQYEEIVKWIENNGHKEWFYSNERANHVIMFAENYCHHSKGKMAGKKVELELWEKAYFASVYGFIDIEGNRKHQRVVLIVGKKNGKSLLDSIQGLYALVADNEGGAEVYSVATTKSQAKIVWTEAKRMIAKSPILKKRVKTLVGEINSEFNDGIFKPLASKEDSLDGLNVHLVIMDEWHQWKNGRALYDIMADGITAREQPLIVMTSTAGTIRMDLFDQIYEEAEIQFKNLELDGEIDDRSLFFIYEIDKKSEWRDANNWIKANPGLGTIKKLRALQDKAQRVADNPILEKNFICKEFSIRETSNETFLTFDELNNTDTYDIKELKPRYAVGGIDLSSTTDLTCATILFRVSNDDPVLYCHQMYWLPSDLLEKRTKEDKIAYDVWYEQGLLRLSSGNKINFKDVTDWFLEIQDELDIYLYKIGYDSWGSTYMIDSLQANHGKNTTIPVVQGAKTQSNPLKTMKADLAAKRINYNNNPLTKWNFSNSAVSVDRNDNLALVKTSNQRLRIDGVASFLDAFVVYLDHQEDYMNII